MKAKQELSNSELRHIERVVITTVALVSVLAAVIVKATLLGEFTLHVGW